MTLRVASYNLRFGGIGRKAAISASLASLQPDLVILQEATDQPTVEWIGQRLGLDHVVVGSGRSVAALSRQPLDSAWHEIGLGRSALELKFRLRDFRIFGVHLSAGLSQRGESRRMVEVSRLLGQIDASGGGERTMIVGDFNAIAPGDGPLMRRLPLWIRILLRFDGGIRTEAMSSIAAGGFADAFRLLHPDDPGFTMPSTEPSVRLDYIMLGSGIRPLLRSCELMNAGRESALATDHLAVLAELGLGEGLEQTF